MALLEVDQVAAGYVEGIDMLAGIGLRVEAGSVTGIIGPNGAGKSTLLKTIFGFLHPREGRIVHDGREIQRAAPHEIKRLGGSYVPQGANGFLQLTGQEDSLLGAWVERGDRARVGQRLGRGCGAVPRASGNGRRR